MYSVLEKEKKKCRYYYRYDFCYKVLIQISNQ